MNSDISAFRIKVNNFIDPLGINGTTPEISWQISGSAEQSAWQIRAAETPEDWENGNFIWDSGKIDESFMSGHLYGGRSLSSRERIFFKVKLFDETGREGEWSEFAFFETGLLEEDDWSGHWIGFPPGWSGCALGFQKDFKVAKSFSRGRLYVAGSCVETFLNGEKLGGNAVLIPAQTDYSKSFHYLVFDVSKLLLEGDNRLSFHVGSAWYGHPLLRYQLEIDGEVLTSSHFMDLPLVHRSPVSRNSFFGGEEYDANMEFSTSWQLPGGDLLPVPRAAFRVPGPSGIPRGLEEESITTHEEIMPVNWEKIGEGHYSVDFGRNFAGWCRLKISAPAGTRISMKFSESRYADLTANQENLLGDIAMDVYIAKGDGIEIFEPHFTYHGFRYVEIDGLPGEFSGDTLTGIVLHTDCRRAGEFKCSNELVNRIFTMIRHTEESNLFAVPTDCPQRTERMGWLNDIMARNESSLYLFDESNLMTKWLEDIAEAQDEKTGEIPMTAPFYWGFDIDPVCSSFIEAAWNNLIYYGKYAQLNRLYPQMRRWLDRMTGCCDDDGILRRGGFVGDWVPPLKFNNGHESPQNFTVPHELVSTALMHYAGTILRRIAERLGKIDEVAALDGITAEIRQNFLRQWRCGRGRLSEESQSAYAYAVYCGLFPEDECQCAADRLAELFAGNGFKHTTGNIGTKYLLEVLAQYGYIEYAWKLISSEDYPGWGYMLANGATTLWERWELAEGAGMNSHNHPMLGCPCAWLFRHIAGIRIMPDSTGANHLELSAQFPANLDSASAYYDSAAGMIRTAWYRECGKIIYHFTLPPGVSARVRQADGTFTVYRAGVHQVIY